MRFDHTGKKYGMLTAIRYVRHDDKFPVWLFRCECGGEIERRISSVIKHIKTLGPHNPNCGCVNLVRKETGVAQFNRVVNSYKLNAKKRGLEFSLTDEQCKTLFSLDCWYCGSPPGNVSKSQYATGDFVYSGIDRVDNGAGYIDGNVLPCCGICNHMKWNMSKDEFLDAVYRISVRLVDSPPRGLLYEHNVLSGIIREHDPLDSE